VRRDRLAALSALIVAAALLPGCLPLVGAGAAAYATLEDRRSTATQIEDEGIEVRTTNRLEALRERAHVNVTAFNGAVLLTGEAWDEATRAEAEKLVAGVPNVRSVTNEIQVAGASSMTSRTNDTALTAQVKGRFLNAKEFNSLHVKVVTEAGVVYLLGLVTEAEAAAATEIARTTGGVRKVIKVFEYCKSTDEQCRPPPPADKPKPPRA
jgi:osmotically-inducible protein OsmY